MKKKIFTFLTLLVCTVTGAWAQTTLFSWTSKTGISNTDISAGTYTFTNAAPGDWLATVSGGTVVMEVPENGNMRIRGSQLAFNSSNSYFKITLSEALAAGDQIDINSTGNTNNLWFSVDGTRPSKADNAAAVIVQGTTYTITPGNDLIGVNEFYIWRAGSTTQVGTFTITRPAPSTDPVIYADDASIKATESGVEVTTDIDVTGANLAASGTLTATLSPAVPGLTVSLASTAIDGDGAITTTATLHYTQTVNTKGETTLILSDGDYAKNVTISYTAKVTLTPLETISTATEWDFGSKVSGAKQFTTDEDKNTEWVYADIDGLTFTSPFNENALAFKGEYPFRDNSHKYAQNGILHFKTSVPGTVYVKFSDTGSTASSTATKRYLVVNDIQTPYWASRANNNSNPEIAYEERKNVEANIAVPAGDVYVNGTQALTIPILSFTPGEATSVSATITAAGVASFSSMYEVEIPAGVTAYYASAGDGSSVTLTAIDGDYIPANTGVVLKGAANTYSMTVTSTGAALAGTNLLRPWLNEGEPTDATYYTLAAGPSFAQSTGGTLAAGKAYLVLPVGGARELSINFGEVTGIKNIEAQKQESGDCYNLAGQRVAQPTKGLYIVNGKKYIVK